MPPKTRTPKVGTESVAEEARRASAELDTAAAPLPPSPGNGVGYVDHARRAAAPAAVNRRGVPLGLRIPRETFEHLAQVSELTGITRQRLLTDALEAYLPQVEQRVAEPQP